MSIAIVVIGLTAVFALFFLLLWSTQREAKFSAQISGMITLNVATAIAFSWGMNEAVPYLASELLFWTVCVLWAVALILALWSPWYFFGNRPR